MIVHSAERFAEGLVETGTPLGVSEFALVQWLDPPASAAPELLVAGLYAWRLNTNAGLGTLVPSKVDQRTLLVGTLPTAFAVASSSPSGLPIIARQCDELFLTAAPSSFAICALLDLPMSLGGDWTLIMLFWTQSFVGAFIPADKHGQGLIAFAALYIVLGLYLLVLRRDAVPKPACGGLRAPYAELAA